MDLRKAERDAPPRRIFIARNKRENEEAQPN